MLWPDEQEHLPPLPNVRWLSATTWSGGGMKHDPKEEMVTRYELAAFGANEIGLAIAPLWHTITALGGRNSPP